MSAFGGPNIVDNGLRLYLDSGNRKSWISGSRTWYDLSGNNFHATVSGSISNFSGSLFLGRIGQTSSYISVPTASLEGCTSYSIDLWIARMDGNTDNQCITSFSGAGGINVGGTFITSNNELIYLNGVGSASPITTFTASFSTPYNLTITANSSSKILSIYQNGRQIYNSTYGSDLKIISTSSIGFIFGQDLDSPSGSFESGQSFLGSYYKIRLYNRDLTPQEVSQNYNATYNSLYYPNVPSNMGAQYVTESGLALYLDSSVATSFNSYIPFWYDVSGARISGSLTNGILYTGSNGGSLVFDGVDDYVPVLYTASLAPTTSITFGGMAFRSNWSSYTSGARLLSKTQNGGYQIAFNEGMIVPTGYVSALVHVGGTYMAVSSSLSTLSNGWHHFFFTCDGRYLKLYIDGSLIQTTDRGSTAALTYNVNNALQIGTEASSGTNPDTAYFSGQIPYVKIYSNRVLSDAEILADFNSIRSRFGL